MPQILLYFATIVAIAANISCHKIPDNYLLGDWETTDSTTGEKKLVTFNENKTVVFHSEKTEWVYSYKIQDSVILLDYTLYDENITGLANGVLLVQNDTCFWWFNPKLYERYQYVLKMGYHVSTPDQFRKFLKNARWVYCRVIRK